MRNMILDETIFPDVIKKLNNGYNVIIDVTDDSMFPFIIGGNDRVMISPLSKSEIPLGAIILAQTVNGTYVLNRKVKNADENGYITLISDGGINDINQCHEKNIIGIARKIIRPNATWIELDKLSERRKGIIWYNLLPIRRYLINILRKFYI